MKEHSKHIGIYIVVGVLGVLLGVPSALAQTNQTSQQQGGNQTGNQSSAGGQQQQQPKAIPPPAVIAPITNETSEGFANVTDVENLTGLNFGTAEGEGATGGQQQLQQQGGNQTGNQSSAGGQQQLQQHGNQSDGQQGPLEQIEEAIGDVFSGN